MGARAVVVYVVICLVFHFLVLFSKQCCISYLSQGLGAAPATKQESGHCTFSPMLSQQHSCLG
jgi:hypothetical protein